MKNKNFILVWVILWMIVLSPFLYAQTNVTKYAQAGMLFLKIDPDGRSAGMGNAITALPNNSLAMFSNPASMGFTKGVDLSILQTNWIADIKHYAIGASYTIDNIGTFGVNFVLMDYGDMIRTVPYSGNDPTLIDVGYQNLGNFTVSEYAIGLSYSRQINNNFSIGATTKYVHQDLGWSETIDVSSGNKVRTDNVQNLIAFDFGTLYNTGWKDLRFGMSIRNFSGQGRYVEQRFEIPLTMTMGVAMNILSIWTDNTLHQLNAAIDWSHPRDFDERIKAGLEYGFMNMFFIRGGYKFNYDEQGLTFGLGVEKEFGDFGLRFNYAYNAFGVFFGSVNRIGLSIYLK